MTPNVKTGWIAEDDLQRLLNVDREKLREAREKMAGGEVDTDGPWVVWKKSAAARWAAQEGLTLPDGALETPERLTVVSKSCGGQGYHFPNKNIIKAKRENGEVVVVRVMDSSKYTDRLRTGGPMEFLAVPSKHGAVWVLTGREPRFRGAW